MTTVTLLKRFAQRGGPAYNVGERIALDDTLAASLLTQGIARAYDAPPVHRMIVTAPIAKDFPPPRKGRPYVK
jgi:hypothetical protein